MVKLKNPVHEQIKELKAISKDDTVPESISKQVDRIELKYVPRVIRFFYPYEVQIYDQVSGIENEKGRSAHHEYKRSQVKVAMKRVMGNLMDGSSN